MQLLHGGAEHLALSLRVEAMQPDGSTVETPLNCTGRVAEVYTCSRIS